MAHSVMKKVVYVLGAFLLWYLLAFIVQSGTGSLAHIKLPYPHQLVELIYVQRSELAGAAWLTLIQAVIGFVVGSVVGLAFAVFLTRAIWLESGFTPLLLAAQMVPVVALVPLAQSIFRNDTVTRTFIAAFITFFAVTVAVVRGMKMMTSEARELVHSYDASKWARFRYLEFPAALPMLFSGLRIAAPLSLVGSILVDFTGAQAGLGYVMVAAVTLSATGAMVAWGALIILFAMGFLMIWAVNFAERLFAPWYAILTDSTG